MITLDKEIDEQVNRLSTEHIYVDEQAEELEIIKELEENKDFRHEEEKRYKSEEESIGSLYDMYDLLTRVHAPTKYMNKDFTLAKYDGGIVDNKFARFVREQLKIITILRSWIVVPLGTLKERYENDKAIEIYKGLLVEFWDMERLLLDEIYHMIIQSRCERGEIAAAMIIHGKNREERDELAAQLNANAMMQHATSISGKLGKMLGAKPRPSMEEQRMRKL